jgi:hypothetical protein
MNVAIIKSYDQSRQAFRELATHTGALLDAIRVPSRIEQNLTVDIAYLKPTKQTNHLVIITCGVHGAEAPIGAAIQRRIMEDHKSGNFPDRDTGYLLIHAVNPFGFRHLRRVTENNVDLNRNCVLSPEEFATLNLGYEQLHDILNPKRPYEGSTAEFIKTVVMLFSRSRKMGYQSIVSAIAAGQYQFAQGIMFGGNDYETQIGALTDFISRIAKDYSRALMLDIHTGLGPKSAMQLLSNTSSIDAQHKLVDKIFGRHRVIHSDAKNYYSNSGDFSSYLAHGLTKNGKIAVPIVVEFGTLDSHKWLGSAATITRIVAENQIWWHGSKNSMLEIEAKRRFEELFCPSDPNWQESTLHLAQNSLAQFCRNFSV